MIDEWQIEQPHHVIGDNCQGQEDNYWRAWAIHKDKGKAVCGCSDTPEGALAQLKENLKKENK